MRVLRVAGAALCLTIAAAPATGRVRGFQADTEPTSLVVTTASDVLDGDVSSVDNLKANPGPDGVSLREAILATNNDPGTYAVTFDPSLAGATVVPEFLMDSLTGGNVSIDGDIDGDGHPDITIRNPGPSKSKYVIEIASGGNRLAYLKLKGAHEGVIISPAPIAESPPRPRGQTFSGTVLRGLIIRNVSFAGIALASGESYSGCRKSACESHNTWRDTLIVGNTISARDNGIEISPSMVIGDRVAGLEIRGNKVRLASSACEAGVGVNIHVGNGLRGTAENVVTHAVVSGNTILGDAQAGIRLIAGEGAGDRNRVVDARVVGNRIDVTSDRKPRCMGMGVFVASGDGATDIDSRQANPLYPEGNIVRNVVIKRNELAGWTGIRLMAGCCGARSNEIRNVTLRRNTIESFGLFGGIGIQANFGGGRSRDTADNKIVGVDVDANRIKVSRLPRNPYPHAGGGVSITGGYSFAQFDTDTRGGKVKDIRVTDNRIDARIIGINVVGGWGLDPDNPIGNVVSGIVIAGNRVLHPPLRAVSYSADTKGISLLGGGLDARRNRVGCVRIRNNIVAGVTNAYSILTNYSVPQYATSTGNVVRRGCG